jgi:hypothetical protein
MLDYHGYRSFSMGYARSNFLNLPINPQKKKRDCENKTALKTIHNERQLSGLFLIS